MTGENRFAPEVLERLLTDALAAGGFTADAAMLTAAHLIDAEVKGVVSHGVNRLGWYLGRAKAGDLNPKAVPRVVRDDGPLLLIDGDGGIGIPAMELALDAVLGRAASLGVAVAGVVNLGHTGRMGAYAERGARAGYFCQVFGGGGWRKWAIVAPHGGVRPILSTNPYAFGFPLGDQPPAVADFATSLIANGKATIARATGKPLPEGAALDKHGRPTLSPAVYQDGGALMPAAGHKGSGMSVIAELVGDAMMGEPHEFNWLLLAVKADAFRPLDEVTAAARAYADKVRATPPAEGVDRVMLPGEPEARLAAERASGVPLDPAVWDGIVAAARAVGIDAESYGVRLAGC
jgi:LDH2 family malate/lactate/ureidoglycolate dehydrogenase